ncbi:MAG: nuclear transport factor 2 family protein [Cohaesibacteraceae bacterium]
MKLTASTIAALTMSASATAAADVQLGGTPLTLDTLVDQAEMVRIADAIDAGVDAKDWEATRSFFTDEITVDFTSLVGGDPATIPADGLIAAWSGNLTAEKTSFHLRGNHRVSFHTPDSATMISHGYAWNRMESGALLENGGEALWEVWGTYVHGFVRTEDGWRVNAMTFTATAQRGNEFVRDTPGA